MKVRMVFFIAVTVLLTSCELYVVEPAFDSRDLFTGDYHINEYSSTFDEYWEYSLSIYKSGYGSDVMIENFYNSDLRVWATVSGNRISIPWQTVDGYEISGSGYINGRNLTLNYNVRDTYTKFPVKDFCNSNGTRF